MPIENEDTATEETVQDQGERTPAAQPEKFDRAALESKVTDRLAAAFGDDAEVETDEEGTETEEAGETAKPKDDAEETADDADESEEKPDEEQEAPTEEDDDEKEESGAAAKDAKATAKAAKNDDAPTLPAAFRRSLKAYEWTDAEIDANLKTLGTKFIETASKIHQNRNAEISQWAAAGRAAREDASTQNADRAVERKPNKDVMPTGLKPLDTAKLKQQYGEDTLIDEIVTPVNAVIEQLNKLLPAVQQTQQRSQQAELETLGRSIDEFFGGKELMPYKEVYGNATKQLTQEQLDSRNKVLETADALMAGAKLQGRKLTLGEALQLSHDSVSSGFKVQAVRTQIKNDLKARSKGVSLKPSGRKSAAPAKGGVFVRSSLEKRVSQGMKAVFG